MAEDGGAILAGLAKRNKTLLPPTPKGLPGNPGNLGRFRRLRRAAAYVWRQRGMLMASAKQLISFYQIAGAVPELYRVRMPPSVQSLLTIVSFASLNLDVLGMPWRCFGINTFFTRFLAAEPM